MTSRPNETAVIMAAVHILTKTEDTRTGSDVLDHGSYRMARLREVAQLAWDLSEAVKATKPEPPAPELDGNGVICERCCTFTPLHPADVAAAIEKSATCKRCGTMLTASRRG